MNQYKSWLLKLHPDKYNQGIDYLAQFYSSRNDAENSYNAYLDALANYKLNPSFKNTDVKTNGAILTKLWNDTNGNYFYGKLAAGYENGSINKIFFNPARYISETISSQTSPVQSAVSIATSTVTGSVKDVGTIGKTVISEAGDFYSMFKNLLPIIIIGGIVLLAYTYLPKKKNA